MQSSAGDVPFVECLSSQGILPGIKVDEVCHPACQVIFHAAHPAPVRQGLSRAPLAAAAIALQTGADVST